MSKLRDPKKFKIYVQTILIKKSETISKKVFTNYVTGLFELNKIFKDYLNMKFVMKMKSEMDQEKLEEEKILAKEDYKTPKDIFNNNNLNTIKENQLKTDVYNKAQLRNNMNSNKESNNLQNKKIENNILTLTTKNESQLNNPYDKNKNNLMTSGNQTNSGLRVFPLKEPFIMTKKILIRQENKNMDNKELNQNSTKNITINNLKLDNKLQQKQSQSSDNTANKFSITNNDINLNNQHVDYTITTIKKTEVNEYPINTRSNQNFNNTQINLKQKILDQNIRPGDFAIIKRDNETIQSTSVTRTENSDYDMNNSRRTEKKILNNDSHLNRTKNDSRFIKDILTDDLTDFPDLRLPSQKKENLPFGDPKNLKKDLKNDLKLMEVIVPTHEQNEKTYKKNEVRNVIQQNPEFVIPIDKKFKKPENKTIKAIDSNYERKTVPVFTLIETPNYGTVSFIGQRYEKIEIDQWRDD